MSVIKECAGQLEPGIKQFIISSMSRENSSSNPEIDYREVIYDISLCSSNSTRNHTAPNKRATGNHRHILTFSRYFLIILIRCHTLYSYTFQA